MGTRYHVTLPAPPEGPGEDALRLGIEAVLEEVNASMSTYRSDSEINRVNAAEPGDWIALSSPFAAVLAEALDISRRSAGYFDVTVGPLVDLWGFGPTEAAGVPTAAELEVVLAGVGYSALELDRSALQLRKQASRELDFSSLAKGYAVDRVALWLQQQGIADYLVEIGGEIRVSGRSPRGSN